jgi:hypothetical protein
MNCLVCHASFAQGSGCPQCGYDQSQPGASDAAAVLAAREAFKAKVSAYAPGSRVTAKDKLRPWLALGLGLLLFVFWVRTCASGGRFF